LRTKLLSILAAAATAGTSVLFPGYSVALVVAIVLAHGIIGILRSSLNHIDPFNDIPNTFRIFLASCGGLILPKGSTFVFPSLGFLLILAGVSLNDESQRRILDSVLKGRRGGAVVLLGIDGSGKSTHALALKDWFERRGYDTTLVPFHRYLFLDALKRGSGLDPAAAGRRRSGNPLRPAISLLDNLLSYILSSWGKGLEGRVIIYDRFIWSTYVKYSALGYPVNPLRWLYMLPRPKVAIVLDIPTERSLGVIQSRAAHIRYTAEVLNSEREEYLALARGRNYPVVDSGRSFDEVQREIERILSGVFPLLSTGGTG
jgi:thymidylate kinase